MAEVSTLYYSEGGLSYSEGCTKGQRWRVVLWAILRKESLMADLIEAAKQGNGPGVTVAPHTLVAEFRGLWQ